MRASLLIALLFPLVALAQPNFRLQQQIASAGVAATTGGGGSAPNIAQAGVLQAVATSLTTNITIAGSGKLLMVGITIGGAYFTSVTLGGSETGWTALYITNWYSADLTTTHSVYYLKNPPDGTSALTVNITSSTDFGVAWALITNANQTTTFGAPSSVYVPGGGATNISGTVASAIGDLVVDFVGNTSAFNGGMESGQHAITPTVNTSLSQCFASASNSVATATTKMSWAFATSANTWTAVAVKP